MHRSSPSALLVAGVVLLLTACGTPASGEAAGAADGGEASVETRTVTGTTRGDVADVPVDPQRVVALWRTGSELADLGVVPVGALDGELLESELGPELYAAVADVPTVGTFEGVDVEEVISLEPDLIVGMDHGGLSIDYDELSEVAPVVVLPIEEPTDVWDNYPQLADVLGLSTDFAQRQAALDADLADLAAEHGERLGALEVTSLGAYEGTIWVDTSKSLSFRRLDEAGFGYNPAYTADPERYAEELSPEDLADLSSQDALFYDTGLDGTPTPDTAAVMQQPSFTGLPAVQAGRAFPLTSGTIYTFAAAEQQVSDLRAAAEVLAAQP